MMIVGITMRRGGGGVKSGMSARLEKVREPMEQYLRLMKMMFDTAMRGMQLTVAFMQEIRSQHFHRPKQTKERHGGSLTAGKAATVESGTCNVNTKDDKSDDTATTGIAIMITAQTATERDVVTGTT